MGKMFQSLFYWMYVKNSLLNFSFSNPSEFQSLFYWMYVKNDVKAAFNYLVYHVSILVLLDVCKELPKSAKKGLLNCRFNPCFIGCM